MVRRSGSDTSGERENCSIGLIAGPDVATFPSPRPHPLRPALFARAVWRRLRSALRQLAARRRRRHADHIPYSGRDAKHEKNNQKKPASSPTHHPVASRSGRQPRSPPQTRSRRATQAPSRSQTCRISPPSSAPGRGSDSLRCFCKAPESLSSRARKSRSSSSPSPRSAIRPFPPECGCKDRTLRAWRA